MSKKVVIASNNAHKVAEVKTILAPTGWTFLSLKEAGADYPEPEEDAGSFEGNARIKARAAHEALGMAALADDSGLCVDALDGAPGVYSSRFSGPECNSAKNNALLLEKLADVPDDERRARFICTIVFIDEDGSETVACGTCEGRIGYEERGDGGFGYDPLFISDDCDGLTTAEVSAQQKNEISHRGRALRALAEQLS